MSLSNFPLARHENLIAQSASDELVIYDKTTNMAYVLNPCAANVWQACNGKRSVKEITLYLSRETPMNEQAVRYALRELGDLLESPVTLPQAVAGMSRRQFLKHAGLAAGAAAIPVVVKMVAPGPAAAQSNGTRQVCCICFNNASPSYWYMGAADCADCEGVCAREDNGFAIGCNPSGPC